MAKAFFAISQFFAVCFRVADGKELLFRLLADGKELADGKVANSSSVSGRKVELDEVIVPSPELESSSSQKSVPMIPTPISEEANDDDHETSVQVTTEPRRSSRVWSAPEWYGNPILEVMLLP